MADWFRNTQWNEHIEAAFKPLQRARGKAQYLNIQAYTLLATHPRIAAALCLRAIGTGDAAQAARSGLYLGTALAIDGDLDGAIAALEGAIDAEQREPCTGLRPTSTRPCWWPWPGGPTCMTRS